MPLEIYKRRHSDKCLRDINERIAAGKLTIPKTVTMFSFLQQYAPCKCAWWIRGTNDHGKAFTAHSLKVYSKTAAETEARKLNQPDAPDRLKVSVKTATEEWLEELRLAGKPSGTVDAYRNSMLKLADYYKDQFVCDIDSRNLNRMRAAWMDSGMAKWTRRNYFATVGMFLKWASIHGLTKNNQNPYLLVQREGRSDEDDQTQTLPLDPEGGDGNYRLFLSGITPYLTANKKKRGALTSRPDHLAALCELMYETGLRISDAIMFKPGMIERNDRCGVYVTKQRKTKRPVTVYLPLPLVAKLQALPTINGPFLFWGAGAKDYRDYVLAEVNRPLKEIGEDVGVAGVRPHRFRDSFAVNKLNENIGYDVLKDLLGHSDLKTTQRYYAPWVKSRETAMIDRLFPAAPKVVDIDRVPPRRKKQA